MSSLNDNDNRRSLPRKEAMQRISAVNLVDGESMGIVINLHTEGFMLLGRDTLPTDQVYKIEFRFDYPINGANNLQINARCLWLKKAEMPGQAWLGFSIVSISEEDSTLLHGLIL